MNFTDSHCHLDYPDYGNETDRMIKRAENVGVSRFLTIGTSACQSRSMVNFAQKYDSVFAAIGIHPEYAVEELDKFETLSDLPQNAKVVAIGEAGLDYHYGAPDTHEVQRELFRKHLKMAKKTGLPIVIHTRDAEQDTIDILKQEADSSLRGVLHCFSSGKNLAEFGLEIGFYISASGIITFKKADDIRDVFKSVPADRLLIETDAPYLAPTPYRGKTNEPAFIVKTAEKLAEIRGCTIENIADVTTNNFLTLFSKAK